MLCNEVQNFELRCGTLDPFHRLQLLGHRFGGFLGGNDHVIAGCHQQMARFELHLHVEVVQHADDGIRHDAIAFAQASVRGFLFAVALFVNEVRSFRIVRGVNGERRADHFDLAVDFGGYELFLVEANDRVRDDDGGFGAAAELNLFGRNRPEEIRTDVHRNGDCWCYARHGTATGLITGGRRQTDDTDQRLHDPFANHVRTPHEGENARRRSSSGGRRLSGTRKCGPLAGIDGGPDGYANRRP